jgi:AbrB family looped-hinge helix DNA binding protein
MTAQTRVSAKGQVVIPKSVRDELGWPPGTRLDVERVGGALTLRAAAHAGGKLTVAEFLARRPKHEGPPLTLEEIEARVERAMTEHYTKEYKTRR